jgi:hypothetical protein
MTKKMNKICMALIGLSLIVSPVWAADYSSMTTEDLANLRGTMRSATPEEQTAFQNEWQSRQQQMTPDERQQYKSKSANGPQDGSGNQYGKNKQNKKAYSYANRNGSGYGEAGGIGARGGRGSGKGGRGGRR